LKLSTTARFKPCLDCNLRRYMTAKDDDDDDGLVDVQVYSNPAPLQSLPPAYQKYTYGKLGA